MHPRLFGSSALLVFLFACDGGDNEPGPGNNGGVTDCDADDDGVERGECGGPDCDDDDPDIYPGASDPMGDEVDQSCDGDPNATLTVIELGAGEPLGAGVSENGLRVGGVVAGSDGHLYGRTASVGGGALEDHDYGAIGLYADAVRVYDGDEGIDVLAVADGADWRLDTHRGDEWVSTFSGVGMLGDLDATLDGEALRMVACGGGNLAYQHVDLSTGDSVVATRAEWPAHDRCVVLAAGDEPVIVTGSSLGGTLVRLRVGEAGFDDYLVLANDVTTEELVAATAGETGIFGYADGGDVMVFDVDGNATVLGGAESVLEVAVDITPAGEAAIGWIDDTGAVHLAVGSFPDRLTEVALEPSAWPERIAVSVRTGGATVAMWEGTAIEVAELTR